MACGDGGRVGKGCEGLKKIGFEDKFEIEIDGQKQKIEFDLGAMRELGVAEFDKMTERLASAHGVIEALYVIANRAVKKYNRDYNAAEMPFTYRDIADILVSVEKTKKAEAVVRVLYFLSLPKKKEDIGIWHEDIEGKRIEPTANRLVVMGLTVLGLSLDEVLSMTAAEVSELLEDYAYINNTKEDAREKYRGKDVKGVGSGDELEKVLNLRLP